MKKIIFFFLLPFMLIILASCQGEPITYPTGYFVPPEALKVYGVALDSLHVTPDKNNIYVLDSTIVVYSFAMRSYSYLKSGYPELEEETYNSFVANTMKRYALTETPSALKNHIFLCSKCNGIIGQPGNYGTVYFSNVGFNTNKTQAVVLVFEFRGDLAASMYYLILTKQNNTWLVKHYVLVGIS